MAPKHQPNPPRSRCLLRRADQAAVAGLLLAALISMAGWWLAHGGGQGNLIELERMPHRTAQFQVDLNEADWPELSQLPGVGETLAQRIVESRQTDGAFVDNEDLQRVRGIGPRTFERIKPYLRPTPGSGSVAGR
jgi:competence protein ComEA